MLWLLEVSLWVAFRATGIFSMVVLTACARADGPAASAPSATLQVQGGGWRPKKNQKVKSGMKVDELG